MGRGTSWSFLYDSAFWTLMPAAGGYLFRPYSGNGFLHLNPSDGGVTLSTSSGIDEHTWNVTEFVPEDLILDVGNFTFVNLTTGAHLAVNPGGTAAPQRSAAPDNVNKTWTAVRSEDGSYQFITQDSSEKFLQVNDSALEIGTNSDNSKWLVDIDYQTGSYTVRNVATGYYLADQNNTLTLLASLPDSKAGCLWKFKDFFALSANPEDKVEFALHNLFDNSYLQYNSIFSDTSPKTLVSATFNPVVDETVTCSTTVSKNGYTARTLDICQRFIFEKVGEGENAYYHILPYLRLQEGIDTEIKGSYRTEYRLIADGNSVKMAQMSETNGVLADPASGRWKLEQLPGGLYWIYNMASDTPKYLSTSGELTVKTSQTLWDLKALCLNMEKDYQRYSNTCGMACGAMILNYLTEYRIKNEEGLIPPVDEKELINTFLNQVGGSYSTDINVTRKTVNKYLDADHQYSSTYTQFNPLDFQSKIATSLKKMFPTIINIKPEQASTNQLNAFGYGYGPKNSDTDGGHYISVKGIYYNSTENRYESVINDPHYKFGAAPLGKYEKNSNTFVYVNIKTTDNIGGRDTVITYDMLYQVYEQRYFGFMYMQ